MMGLYDGFAQADEKTLQEIIREAESYLSAQLTASIAADQRAVAFASLLAAATVVVAGGGGAILLDNPANAMLGWICLAVAGGFIMAMAFANLSAMPADFWYAGNSPAKWIGDVNEKRSLVSSLAQQAEHYSDMISENDDLMRRNNRQMLAAVWIAWGALAIGAIASTLALLCS